MILHKIRDFVGITIGSIITALALDVFTIPHKIAAGGVSGIATVLHHLFGFPVGITMLFMDVPLFLVSLRVLGVKFGIKTLYGALVLSVSIDILSRFVGPLTKDIMLNALYGGVLSGIGLGLVFKYNGSTAGTDLLAKLLNRFTGISVGQSLLGVDFLVIAAAGIAFGSAELSMYALISLFVTSQIIDLVQAGKSYARAFFIITNHTRQIADKIMEELDRGVTLLRGEGAYSHSERDVLFVVVSSEEITKLKDIVHAIDPQSFVIVADVHEVLGEGFLAYRRHSS